MTNIDTIKTRKADYRTKIQSIRDNPDYTDSYKQKLLAREYKQHRNTMRDARTQFDKEQENTKLHLQQRLFGSTNTLTGADSISFRDAYDRANSPETAVKLITQARITGDRILSRGVLSAAFTHGWGDVIDTYSEAYEDDAPLIQEARGTLYEDPADTRAAHVGLTALFSAGKPDELRRYSDTEIDDIADDA